MKYKVAVITRTLNRPIFLKRALKSLLDQTFKDFIWVVINDGGIKESVEIIVKSAAKEGLNVSLIHNDVNQGMERSSNIGINSVDSEYIVIHDDDDTWEPDFLDTTVSYLEENPNSNGVVTHSLLINEEIHKDSIKIINSYPYNDWLKGVYISDMADQNLFPPISFLFKRSVMNEIGLFNESLPVLGDWDFHLRFIEKYDISVIPSLLANYHIRPLVTNPGDLNGNSVTAGIKKHEKYDPIVRNAFFRRNIEHNQLGYFVTLGRVNSTMKNTELQKLGWTLGKYNVVGKIDKLFSILYFLYKLTPVYWIKRIIRHE
jgi:glycosyltransferase involved in cell wall biosynthesis